MRVEGNRVTTMPGLVLRLSTDENGGDMSIWACPPSSCRARVLSSGTLLKVTLSR